MAFLMNQNLPSVVLAQLEELVGDNDFVIMIMVGFFMESWNISQRSTHEGRAARLYLFFSRD